ncbi:type III pantothenate kinase [Alteromonadaceae bacterium BrNp21-10]|nr:type III pantothenate kinase [Alteromonadaceae bacterium BrNp21-10]
MSEQNSPLSNSKVLLLDIGNSRIKACLVENRRLSPMLVLEQTDALMPLLANVNKCLVSAVGQSQKRQAIELLLKQQSIPLIYLQTTAEYAGLRCGYSDFTQLGIDRWLAMLGCKRRCDSDFAVLDFGTAMTCDLVTKKGQHLGGWIAPGIHTMQTALVTQTERLTNQFVSPPQLALGNTTQACINMGTFAAMQGFLLSAVGYMDQHSQDYRIFIGGGDASALCQLAGPQVEYIEHLVFEGMLEFI